ncbi:hypothetical protein NEF87_003441 [Candidatus Lokiarchaeum ossiferum]|uniref:Uncharacterized protein n=1 Tax=Candidatus Lokiarchaeum ossiferum TaxID=2951803 RepID=A0ABY6HUF2_9ARCH|nr:hypothetical protein NEF87_003441 [Candidatus Lokiarchaeum sp. B-35]
MDEKDYMSPKEGTKKTAIPKNIAEERTILKQLDDELYQNKKNHRRLRVDKTILAGKIVQYENFFTSFITKLPPLFDQAYIKSLKNVCIIDSEEYHENLVCISAITLNQKSEFHVVPFILDNLIYKKEGDRQIISQFKKFLAQKNFSTVGYHGENKKESYLFEDQKGDVVNTEFFLRLLRDGKILPPEIQNLIDFENFIGYTRHACPFFKHKQWHWKMYFQAMNHSLLNHFQDSPQRICLTCKKPQDVLLYCSEDAFSAFLVYCLYKQYENVL